MLQTQAGPHEMSQVTPNLLIVEDDNEISSLMSRYLSTNGMTTTVVTDGVAMDRAFAEQQFDLLVLYIMLPGEDGISICRRVRAASPIPIIIVSAKIDEIDRIIGLEMGADDYLTKPFNPRELLARVRANLRREILVQAVTKSAGRVLVFESFEMDLGLRQLSDPQGAIVGLTSAEFDLLRVLVERPRRVITRDGLLDLTKGRQAGPYERSIDILISRIRQKIEVDAREPLMIKTMRGEGYIFTPEVTTK